MLLLIDADLDCTRSPLTPMTPTTLAPKVRIHRKDQVPPAAGVMSADVRRMLLAAWILMLMLQLLLQEVQGGTCSAPNCFSLPGTSCAC